MSDRPGMRAVREFLNRTVCPSIEDACYRIALELRGESNGYWAAMNGAVSARPGKKEQARREARIEAMKWSLALALGLPMSSHQEEIEKFLTAFRDERLAGRR